MQNLKTVLFQSGTCICRDAKEGKKEQKYKNVATENFTLLFIIKDLKFGILFKSSLATFRGERYTK